MTPADFIKAYEQALATQDWDVVEPLMDKDACVTFSNGTVHKGRSAVQTAFEKNFSLIKSETYRMTNVHWVRRDENIAVYLFDFEWTGVIAGKRAAGKGYGSTVLVRDAERWKLLLEHLARTE